MRYNSRPLGLRLVAGVSLAALCVPAAAIAQDNDTDSEASATQDDDGEDRIVVTGSRIANVAPVGATVNVLGREEIESSGQVTLDRMIQDVPQVFDLGFSEASRNEAGGNGNATWSNSINLRGLGPFATLIISNGHRMTTNGRAISPSVLPTLGVERVEVIADGASAIYGSDAVAGVVNLIQRRNLDGAEAFGRIGSTGNGDFWEWSVGAAVGKQFDRGQVMVAYEHVFRSNLAGDDRDFYTSDQTPFGGPDYRVNQCIPGTLIYQGQTYALPDEYTGGPLQAGTQNRCDSLFGQDLFPEQKYDSVNATATYEILDGVEVLFDGYYNRRDFTRQPGSPTQTLSVPESNAFFVAPPFYTPGSGGYQIAYSFREDIGQSLYSGYQTNWQVVPGLRVELSDEWTLETLVGFGRAEDRAGSTTGLDRTALTAALQSSDPNTAFDPYGLFRTTDSTYSSIFSAEGDFPTNSALTTWQANIDGPLFEMPGGEVRVAVGYEGQDFTMILGQGDPNEREFNRKIHSGYAELYIPLVGPDNSMPFIQDLELTAAVRYDDYSDVGGTTNPKFGLNWEVGDGFRLRGSYGTSFRAPTFPEIFGNSTRLYVQNYQNPDGSTTPVSGYGVGSGPNPDLQPETATTWTAGADFEPFDNFTVGLTYFDIAYKDTITNLLSSLNILTLADEYAGTDVILFGQPAYDRIVDIRDNGIGGTPGPISILAFPGTDLSCTDDPDPSQCVFVDARSLNLGRTSMNGIDFNIRYVADLSPDDTLTLSANGTYIIDYLVAFSPGGDFVDRKNNIAQPLTFKARASAMWQHGPLNVRGTMTHVGGYVNDRVNPEQDVDSYTTFDFSAGLELADVMDIGLESAVLGVEVRNAFDQDPSYVNSRPGSNGGGGYDPTVADPIGRFFAVSLRAAI